MKVVVYSKQTCPWCTRIKKLLSEKGIDFSELVYENNDFTREELIEKVGKKPLTVPQVFIDDQHIGGFEATLKYFESLEK